MFAYHTLLAVGIALAVPGSASSTVTLANAAGPVSRSYPYEARVVVVQQQDTGKRTPRRTPPDSQPSKASRPPARPQPTPPHPQPQQPPPKPSTEPPPPPPPAQQPTG